MKNIKILLLMFSLFLLVGCSALKIDNVEIIESPNNEKHPIIGKWEITEVLFRYDTTIDYDDEYIGKECFFHKDAILLVSDYADKPKYNIKTVDLREYLLYRFKLTNENLGLTDQEVKIITIVKDKSYFAEFIKLSDDKMLYYFDDAFYKLDLIDNEVSLDEIERYIEIEKAINMPLESSKPDEYSSGILLGIKTQKLDEDKKFLDWDYETIWINMQNKQLSGVYRVDKILVPRKNGFWAIEQNRVYANESIYDKIEASPIVTKDYGNSETAYTSISADENYLTATNKVKKIPSILKNILFIGNDYVSVENIDIERDDRKTLQVYAIDNLSEEKPIKLSDLIGENGTVLFNDGARNVTNLEKDVALNEENFGLVRRNGYWTLKGRVNYKENGEEFYSDFSIKALPPKDMVSYDNLAIPYEIIKLNVPNVVDVFSSPNNDFIVTVTQDKLVIYLIDEDDINRIPIASIPLEKEFTIIMSEWATGRYPNIWQKILIEQGASEVEVQK